MNMNSTSPEVLFGGQWQQLKARFLCGAGELDTANSSSFYGATPSGYTIWAGETAGENMHTLSIDEMPRHNHVPTDGHVVGASIGGGGSVLPVYNQHNVNWGYRTGDAGSSWSHNNMPPYFAVYMWKRIG